MAVVLFSVLFNAAADAAAANVIMIFAYNERIYTHNVDIIPGYAMPTTFPIHTCDTHLSAQYFGDFVLLQIYFRVFEIFQVHCLWPPVIRTTS